MDKRNVRAIQYCEWRHRQKVKRALSVMMFSWEFPPRVIGGISPHVFFLSKSLAKKGVRV